MPLLTTFGAASVYGYAGSSRTDPYLVTTAYSNAALAAPPTITIPSEAAVGDIAVLYDSTINSASPAPTSVVPSGWTSVNDSAGSFVRVIASYKLLVSGDPGSTITGMAGTNFQGKSLLIFRKSVVATTVSAFSAAGQVTSGDPTPQVVTSSGGVVPIIVVATYCVGAFSGVLTTPTFTPTATGLFTPVNRVQVAYRVFETSPLDVTANLGDTNVGDNALQSFYLQIS